MGLDFIAELFCQLDPELVLKMTVDDPPENLVSIESDVAGLLNYPLIPEDLQSQDALEVVYLRLVQAGDHMVLHHQLVSGR